MSCLQRSYLCDFRPLCSTPITSHTFLCSFSTGLLLQAELRKADLQPMVQPSDPQQSSSSDQSPAVVFWEVKDSQGVFPSCGSGQEQICAACR